MSLIPGELFPEPGDHVLNPGRRTATVVVQNTGQNVYLPNGEGMFRFSTPAEAARAFQEINSDYQKHSRAARQIVETFFDAKQAVKEILSHALK